MRILGIDYGDSRIGVSISDQMGMIASGLDTINSKNNFNKAVAQVADLCTQYDIKTVVVGYPKNMNGTLGERAQKTEGFIEALLSHCTQLEIVRWDERLTSVEAHRTMREIGLNTRKHGKGVVDKIASELILQGYLDKNYIKHS